MSENTQPAYRRTPPPFRGLGEALTQYVDHLDRAGELEGRKPSRKSFQDRFGGLSLRA